jgi:NAD(P)-dependent dehydrogenase (short-subunit alcohol dehydrogenase family)
VRDLTGKTAVVTGAGSGIGRSLARRLAEEGMRVVLADVEEEALFTAVGELGGDVVGMAADVTSFEDVEALASMAFATFGAVDVLCNNAGVFQGGLLWDCSDADFEWTLGVNLWGILHGIRAFVPRMLAAGTEGHVVNTISMAGLASTPFSGPYNVSKFAAMAATECLAHDLATTGAPTRCRRSARAWSTPRSAARGATAPPRWRPSRTKAPPSSSRPWPTAPPGACCPTTSPA